MKPRGAAGAIAFATHEGLPAGSDDDALAATRLVERPGVQVDALPWTTPEVDWGRYSAVVLRSTWDSHLRPADFLAWTRRVEAVGTVVLNPAAVVRWNLDKRYLRDLGGAGVPVVPTQWIPRGSAPDLPAILRSRAWPEAVVKPSVAASGFRTWIARPGDREDAAASIEALLADADALVQPLLGEVCEAGEWSFVFFGSGKRRFGEDLGSDRDLEFSHAVIKRPAAGDFRVQDEFGGTFEPAVPPARLRSQAEHAAAVVARLAPAPLLYVRIDGVVSAGTYAPAGDLLLMEAELIEPALFLGASPEAPGRFADAILARVPAGGFV